MSTHSNFVPGAAWRSTLWIAAIASIMVFGTSTSGVASCGDHLHAPLSHAAERPPFGSGLDTPTPAPTPRCSGPACERGPDAPARSLPIEDRTSGVERLALLTSAWAMTDPGSESHRASRLHFAWEDHRAGLERPPRSA